MVQNTVSTDARGNQQDFDPSDMNDGKILDSSRYVSIFEVQGDTTTAYGPGYGSSDQDRDSGWSDFDLQDDAGNAVAGKFRWEIYRDSSQEDLIAVSSTIPANDLRSAVDADRTNKRNITAEKPAAGNDSWLVLAFKAREAHDGDAVSATNSDSDLGISYSEYR